jgi:hypothetical protein
MEPQAVEASYRVAFVQIRRKPARRSGAPLGPGNASPEDLGLVARAPASGARAGPPTSESPACFEEHFLSQDPLGLVCCASASPRRIGTAGPGAPPCRSVLPSAGGHFPPGPPSPLRCFPKAATEGRLEPGGPSLPSWGLLAGSGLEPRLGVAVLPRVALRGRQGLAARWRGRRRRSSAMPRPAVVHGVWLTSSPVGAIATDAPVPAGGSRRQGRLSPGHRGKGTGYGGAGRGSRGWLRPRDPYHFVHPHPPARLRLG